MMAVVVGDGAERSLPCGYTNQNAC